MRWLLLLFLAPLHVHLSAEQTDTGESCGCIWGGAFVDVAPETDLVVSATVISGKGNSVDLAIDRRLLGTDARDDIRLWLKTADYCRPPAENFPIGSQWVMALQRINELVPGGFNPGTPNVSYGRVGDYSLSSCGGYWLSQTENLVTGNLVNAPRWVREPEMSPVLLDLVADYLDGAVDKAALQEASQEDPALQDLMLDTRAFLRGDEE